MASVIENAIRGTVTKGIGVVAEFNRKRMPDQDHPFLTGIHRPMDSEVTLEDLSVTGTIPPELDGWLAFLVADFVGVGDGVGLGGAARSSPREAGCWSRSPVLGLAETPVDAEVVVCGDYLSPVEIPWLSETGSRDAYLATLERLRPWVEEAAWVVPGHGTPIESARALAILREDVAYLEALPDPAAPLPLARRTAAQRKIHEENLTRVTA